MTQRLRIQLGGQAPAAGSAHFEDFEVNLPSGATLLDALEYIRTGVAPDLMYRHSCHHGSCGTCAVRVDGKEVLACLTALDSLAGGIPVIEPLRALKLEKDLAVDPGALFRSLPKNTSHLRESEVEHYIRFEDCIECGSCVSACPVTARSWDASTGKVEGFLGPAALAAVHRESLNSPERAEEMRTVAERPDGVAACEKHFDCSRVCPRMVYPGKHIEMLRREFART